MPARRKPERKADVLQAMADYLLGSGVAKASLRPAAAAAGTSARMLLYHFSSKEELMVAALREVRRRETAMLAREIARHGPRSTEDLMRRVWRWYASPRRAPYLRVFFEAWGMALQRPYLRKGFLEHVRKDLQVMAEAGLVGQGLTPREASAVATFLIAAFRGMLIDLAASPEDREGRLADAMEVFIDVVGAMSAARATAGAAPVGPKPSRGAAKPKPKARRGRTRPSR
jgi:AcrR family transcriptional regulator